MFRLQDSARTGTDVPWRFNNQGSSTGRGEDPGTRHVLPAQPVVLRPGDVGSDGFPDLFLVAPLAPGPLSLHFLLPVSTFRLYPVFPRPHTRGLSQILTPSWRLSTGILMVPLIVGGGQRYVVAPSALVPVGHVVVVNRKVATQNFSRVQVPLRNQEVGNMFSKTLMVTAGRVFHFSRFFHKFLSSCRKFEIIVWTRQPASVVYTFAFTLPAPSAPALRPVRSLMGLFLSSVFVCDTFRSALTMIHRYFRHDGCTQVPRPFPSLAFSLSGGHWLFPPGLGSTAGINQPGADGGVGT